MSLTCEFDGCYNATVDRSKSVEKAEDRKEWMNVHNQLFLVGRMVGEPETTELAAIITLRVMKPWKNEKGEHETEDFEVIIPGTMGERIKEYLKPGSLVGIRGRLRKKDNIEIVADKVTVLGTKEEDPEGEE